MICTICARAADNRLPADRHCTDPKCMCAHRTDRYQPAPVLPAMIRLLADGEDPDGEPGAVPVDQCRAEYHQFNWPSARCDRPAGHPGNHRDQAISTYYQWHDDRAVYPTEPTTED